MPLQPVLPLKVITDRNTPVLLRKFLSFSTEPVDSCPPGQTDIFSPKRWDDDEAGLDYHEIKRVVDDLIHVTVQSDSFGRTTFDSKVVSSAAIEAFLEHTRLYDNRTGRWRNIPVACAEQTELYSSIRKIIDAILGHFNYRHCVVMDSFNLPAYNTSARIKILPHFMGLGWGSNFGPMTDLFESGPSYAACTSFLELRTERTRCPESDIGRLAHYALRCFIRQHNRKFVYGILATEKHFELYIFDRSGVCYSCPWNIHSSASDFVRTILGIWSPDLDLIGFDTSIYWSQDDRGTWKRLLKGFNERGEPECYILSSPYPIYHRRHVEGRGTTCWSARDRHDRRLVIKDRWDDVKRNTELDFLQKALNAEGVVQFVMAELATELVSKHRGAATMSSIPNNLKASFVDRKFCRIVFVDYGSDTIEHFRGRRELLYGLRDAIAAHQNLWNAGILHGDVNNENILLTRGRSSNVGVRGILIDLDLAMWMDPLRSDVSVHHYPGTWEFASVNVLKNYKLDRGISRDYLDDLESFYYLLCKICATYVGPKMQSMTIPDFIKNWDQSNPSKAASAKMNTMLYEDFKPTVTKYFGKIFQHLLEDLGDFFATVIERKRKDRIARERTGKAAPTWHDLSEASERDYAAVLKLFDGAIEDLTFGRFMPVHDPQLEKMMAELVKARSGEGYISAALPVVGVAPAAYLSSLPCAQRKRMRDEDDTGYEVPPLRLRKKLRQINNVLSPPC